MARRIPLPRLTQRQRTARWQRERRQQAIIVIAFSAILFFVLGLMAWGATDRYYRDNLKAAVKIDGRATRTSGTSSRRNPRTTPAPRTREASSAGSARASS